MIIQAKSSAIPLPFITLFISLGRKTINLTCLLCSAIIYCQLEAYHVPGTLLKHWEHSCFFSYNIAKWNPHNMSQVQTARALPPASGVPCCEICASSEMGEQTGIWQEKQSSN